MDKLITKNNQLIESYKNDKEKLEKQLLIKRLLKEKNCFLKMSIETAYSILKDLGVEENKVREVYLELIDAKNNK